MIDFLARIRRLKKLVFRAAPEWKSGAPRRRDTKYVPRRKPRLTNSSVPAAAPNTSVLLTDRNPPSQFDLTAFCSDLETLRESMSGFAMRATSISKEVEFAEVFEGAARSLENDVAVAVRMLPPRALGA